MANKNSKTPRDYSKEYNAPGSKEQEERNKRKRDKRKHDKLYGECPEGTELHHTNGIENDEVECVPVSKNRGRKEKSRKKKGEVVIRIKRKDADVKKLKEVSSFYGGDPDLPVSKQKKKILCLLGDSTIFAHRSTVSSYWLACPSLLRGHEHVSFNCSKTSWATATRSTPPT